MDNLTETKLTSEKIYSGCILDFYRDTVRLPNGGTAPRELSRHVGAVCIVPLLDDGRVIVERQFRYPVNEVITEIPAGKRDSREEAPEAAARRELREETGITARELIPLGPFYSAAAYSDEVIWMYLARGLTFGEKHIIEYLQTRSSWKLNSMEAVTIHSSIIMIIWNCLIFIVLSGTGTENLSFYMWSPDKLHAE